MLVVVGEVTESRPRTEQVAFFPIGHLPHIHATTCELPHNGKYLRFHSFLHNRDAQTKKNVAKMKEGIKAPKIQLGNEEIDNLSDAEFKTLVVRKLTELVAK